MIVEKDNKEMNVACTRFGLTQDNREGSMLKNHVTHKKSFLRKSTWNRKKAKWENILESRGPKQVNKMLVLQKMQQTKKERKKSLVRAGGV